MSDESTEVSTGGDSGAAATETSTTQNTDAAVNNAGETSTDGNNPASAQPAYVPNLKFKVHYKEKEFDATLKELIKDKKTEDLIRDLYTRADGLEEVKPKYQKVNEAYKTLSQEHSGLVGNINNLSKMVAMDDFDSFFDAIKIPKEQVMRWVHRKLQQMEMPADQRQAYEQQMQMQRQSMTLQEQNQQLQNSLAQQQTEYRAMQLQSVLSRPDTAPVVQAFEAKNGPGSFTREIAMRGVAHYNAYGVDATPEQLVGEYLKVLGNGYVPQAQVQPGTVPVVQAPAATPVIPMVRGSGSASPAKKMVKSLGDLRKIANAME